VRLRYSDPRLLRAALEVVARLQRERTIATGFQVSMDLGVATWRAQELLGLARSRGLLLASGGNRTRGYRLTAAGLRWLRTDAVAAPAFSSPQNGAAATPPSSASEGLRPGRESGLAGPGSRLPRENA
jgi:hypothetical protein